MIVIQNLSLFTLLEATPLFENSSNRAKTRPIRYVRKARRHHVSKSKSNRIEAL